MKREIAGSATLSPLSGEDVSGGAANSLARLVEGMPQRPVSAEEVAYSVLKAAMMRGVFVPGVRLHQEEVASTLQMSRVPVRAALLRLHAEGLVEMRARQGAFVKVHSADEVAEIFEARILLERYAIGRVVAEMTPEWLARLEKRAREVDGVEPGDAFALHSDAFYDELYTPVSPVIARLSQSLRDELGLYWRGARVVGLGKGSHLALLRYVRAGDARGAGLWVERHLRTVAKEITAKLSSLDEHTGHGG